MINNIKNVREQRNLTQKECAENLNISLRAWQSYEQGVSEPKQALLCRIADMFGVTIDYLLGRETTDTLDDLATQYNMTKLEKVIIDEYLSLPKDMREDLMTFLKKAVKRVMSESD